MPFTDEQRANFPCGTCECIKGCDCEKDAGPAALLLTFKDGTTKKVCTLCATRGAVDITLLPKLTDNNLEIYGEHDGYGYLKIRQQLIREGLLSGAYSYAQSPYGECECRGGCPCEKQAGPAAYVVERDGKALKVCTVCCMSTDEKTKLVTDKDDPVVYHVYDPFGFLIMAMTVVREETKTDKEARPS